MGRRGLVMSFDYERKVWGAGQASLAPWRLSTTHLRYAFRGLKEVSGRVLDIGCGAGSITRAISKRRPDLTMVGCDLSAEALRQAMLAKDGVEYYRASAYRLPFKAGSFRAAVSFDVWEHLTRPNQAWREASRILEPGGIFHFFVPTEGEKGTLYWLFPALVRIKREYTGHCQAYSQEQLVSKLEQLGFKVSGIRGSHYYFYQLVDLSYFLALRLLGRLPQASIESQLAYSKRRFSLLGLVTVSLGCLFWLESILFFFLPPGGVHLTLKKE